MILPENADVFKDFVLSKIRAYCDSNVWPFDFDRFGAWLSNFPDPLDEYIALNILNNLIVRSNEMAKASYSRLFSCELYQYIRTLGDIEIGDLNDWSQGLLKGSYNKHIRFAPVRMIEDEGESGSTLYRLISTSVDTDKYSLAKAKNNPYVIILIDDFLGAGQQFIDFATQFDLKSRLLDSNVIYCPLVAMELGCENLTKEFPNLKILPGEFIKKNSGLFDGVSNSEIMFDELNSFSDYQAQVLKLRNKISPNMPYWLGKGDAAIPLVFEWGCPNQAPSIMYMRFAKNLKTWSQLFGRRS